MSKIGGSDHTGTIPARTFKNSEEYTKKLQTSITKSFHGGKSEHSSSSASTKRHKLQNHISKKSKLELAHEPHQSVSFINHQTNKDTTKIVDHCIKEEPNGKQPNNVHQSVSFINHQTNKDTTKIVDHCIKEEPNGKQPNNVILPPEYFVQHNSYLCNRLDSEPNDIRTGNWVENSFRVDKSSFVLPSTSNEVTNRSPTKDLTFHEVCSDSIGSDTPLPFVTKHNDCSNCDELPLIHQPLRNLTDGVSYPFPLPTFQAVEETLEVEENKHSVEPSVPADTVLSPSMMFDLIDIESNCCLLLLHSKMNLPFYGFFTVQLLVGDVEVLGYDLKINEAVNIYSPRGSSLLYFENTSAGNTVLNEKLLLNLNISDQFRETIRRAPLGVAAILCRRLELPKISFLVEHIPQHIFPPSNIQLAAMFNNLNKTWDILKPNGYWKNLAKSLTPNTRLLICGGKSVGKSYLLRYLINKCLQEHPRILVIDLDPGQPEFTISGCISATIVTEPVLGPSYTHLREPYKCVFVPEVNISFSYTNYLEAVKGLVAYCDDLSGMPTIINFMGYTRGLGFQILAAAIAIVRPTNIIEIRSTAKTRNYQEDIEYDTIYNAAIHLAPEVKLTSPFVYNNVMSMADGCQGWHLEPRQIREMLVLCYFGAMLEGCSNSLTHKNVPVYQVDLRKIKLIHNDQVVDPAVMNANLVALCTRGYRLEPYCCHGWGIVRAIDLGLNICYVITPLSLEKLEIIDYFILGAATLPPSVYMSTQHCRGLIPYVAKNILDLHGAIPKRTHLPRRNMTA